VTVGPTEQLTSIEETLRASLSSVRTTFAANELAYLALTSKVELPIRDRLAWRLQEAIGQSLVVSREWRRADLAVLRHDTPLVQIEAKAMYAFDVLSKVNRAKYVSRLLADGSKMALLAPESHAFLLALITHVEGDVPLHLRKHVVKYSAGIVAAIAKHSDATTSKARDAWQNELDHLGSPWSRFTFDGGEQWGLRVEVDAYLVGPLVPA
jgi:hypothetical protein